MARSQDGTAISVLLVMAIIAGSIHSAAAVCANALPAATSAHCSGLSTVVPAGSQISPCNDDPGCGSVRQVSTNTPICVTLDLFCCVQTDCLASNLGGSCKAGASPACSGNSSTPSSLAPAGAPSGLPIGGPGGDLGSNEAIVNTTSNTVTVCFEVPIAGVVR